MADWNGTGWKWLWTRMATIGGHEDGFGSRKGLKLAICVFSNREIIRNMR